MHVKFTIKRFVAIFGANCVIEKSLTCLANYRYLLLHRVQLTTITLSLYRVQSGVVCKDLILFAVWLLTCSGLKRNNIFKIIHDF